MLCFSLSSSGR
jgi:hypothetical protein